MRPRKRPTKKPEPTVQDAMAGAPVFADKLFSTLEEMDRAAYWYRSYKRRPSVIIRLREHGTVYVYWASRYGKDNSLNGFQGQIDLKLALNEYGEYKGAKLSCNNRGYRASWAVSVPKGPGSIFIPKDAPQEKTLHRVARLVEKNQEIVRTYLRVQEFKFQIEARKKSGQMDTDWLAFAKETAKAAGYVTVHKHMTDKDIDYACDLLGFQVAHDPRYETMPAHVPAGDAS